MDYTLEGMEERMNEGDMMCFEGRDGTKFIQVPLIAKHSTCLHHLESLNDAYRVQS